MARILTLSTSYPRFPGDVIAPFIEHISHEITRARNQIDLLLPYHPAFKRKNEKGIEFYLYKYTENRKNMIWGYASSMKADVKLKKRAILLTRKVITSSMDTASQLFQSNEYDIIHAHWLLPNGYIAQKLSQQNRVPYALSLHGSDVTIAERPLFRGISRKILQGASWVSACSEDLRIRAIELGCLPEKIVTIPYGVDTEVFTSDTKRKAEFRNELGEKLKKGDKVILAVGRLVEKKGFKFLIEAYKKVSEQRDDALLVFAGDGDLRRNLENQADRLGIKDRVLFMGNVERDRLPVYFSGCDILAVPSVRDKHGNVDGLPNVLMEGLASGRAIVASDIAGIPNVITDGENGILVEPENVDSLADALVRLIENDQKRKEYGTEARRRSLNMYTWRHSGAKYAEGLKSILR